MARGHEQLRITLPQQTRSLGLVRGISVAVQETDCDAAHPRGHQLRAEPQQLSLVQRDHWHTRPVHPLVDFQAQLPPHERARSLEIQIEALRPIRASDRIHVGKATRGQQRRRRTLALQDGVDGYGRAV